MLTKDKKKHKMKQIEKKNTFPNSQKHEDGRVVCISRRKDHLAGTKTNFIPFFF